MNIRHFLALGVLLMLAIPSFSSIVCFVYASSEETFYSTSADGHLFYEDANYATAHDASVAESKWTEVSTSSLGQQKSGANYRIWRVFLYFDTSLIPESATILSANLTIKTDYVLGSIDDFNITIQNGQPSHPCNPLQLIDYDKNYYSGNGGYLDTTGLATETWYDINITELSWINTEGYTKFALRSSEDISNSAPTTSEYIRFYTSESANDPKLTVEWAYQFTLKGLYDENTGELLATGVNVTSYFSDGSSPETFEVNGTYYYNASSIPLYFSFDLAKNRQYWLSPEEESNTIYIFDDSTTTYTIAFLDLAGVLKNHPYVEAKRYINGSLFTVEKRKVDYENKVSMNLVNGTKYNVEVSNGESYTYGDLLMTSDTTITLTLRGIEFPKEIYLIYKYVRIYFDRAFGTPNGNITLTYQDTLNMTNLVEIFIDYRNGTNAYNATETSSSFIHTWTSALNNTDYQAKATIYHQQYGIFTVDKYFPRTYTSNPWSALAFLGTLPFSLEPLFAVLIILLVGGGFSVVNPEVGAFLATCTAAGLTYIGMIDIAPGALIAAFAFSIMLALIIKKRGVIG